MSWWTKLFASSPTRDINYRLTCDPTISPPNSGPRLRVMEMGCEGLHCPDQRSDRGDNGVASDSRWSL